MSNEQLERGLQASVKIFEFSKGKLAHLAEGETECRITRDEMVSMKKAAAAMNRALTALVRESHEAENRLTLELHMLRGIMKRENTDRDANRAHVFELFRRNSHGDDDGAIASASATAGSNPLTAPTAAAVAIDRALASLDRVDQSVRDLSPVGKLDTHGAGLLSAKASRDAKIAAKRTKVANGSG